MKISNAIAIIALGLQGFLLHTDAASHSPFGLRGGVDSTLADYDTTDDPGYDYAQHLPSRDGQDYPDESEFAVNFDEDEAATDFVLESSGKAGTGVYLQGLPGATRHGARADFLFLLAVVDIIAWTEDEATQSVLIETAVFLQE